jgi:GntR family transcriptional regulator
MLTSGERRAGSGAKRARVRDRLRELIDVREPGTPLPSERDLSEQLGVSRPTLRAAIDDLARDGLLVRQQGRGTFTGRGTGTVSQELAATPPGDYSVIPAAGDWRSRVTTFEVHPAGARLGRRMNLSPASPLLYVVRIRIVDDAPMAIERIRLPEGLVSGIRPADFESGSLYALLRERYGVIPATAVQTTEPTVTDAVEAEQLDVPLHAPALLFERTTRDTDGRVIEYARSVYRGDRYRITTHLKLDAATG